MEVTATEVSNRFGGLIDAVLDGEVVVVTRRGRPVLEMRQPGISTWQAVEKPEDLRPVPGPVLIRGECYQRPWWADGRKLDASWIAFPIEILRLPEEAGDGES